MTDRGTRYILTLVLGFAAWLLTGEAHAQGVVVCEHSDLGGVCLTLTHDAPNFSFVKGPCSPDSGGNFNDCISSISIPPGWVVEACEHANYRGACKLFNGDVSNLSYVKGPCSPDSGGNFNDCISSIRIRRQ